MSKIDLAYANLKEELSPLPELVVELIKKYKQTQPLAGVTALMIQHQLSNQYNQTDALIQLGLDPAKIIWIDIPYTATPLVRSGLLEKLNLSEENLMDYKREINKPYALLEPYAIRQRSRVNSVVKKLLDDPPEKLLVLDDGSYFLESMMCFEKLFVRVGVVEQTTRGIIKIEKSAALQHEAEQIPIINVARSTPKSCLEPPFIAKAVVRNLKMKFKELRFSHANKRVLVLGYGDIGSSVVRFLNGDLSIEKNDIYINDVKLDDKSDRIDGFPLWDRSGQNLTFDLVIGCTGQSSFCVDDFVYVNDGGLLVSCSSGAIEFSRRNFIELADLHEHDDIEILRDEIDVDDMHADIPIRFPHKKITMLNGAWPINFLGNVNCIPAEYIQPTVCMMVRAAVQAVEAMDNGKTGLIDFDPQYSAQLIKRFRDVLGEDVGVLE